MKNYTTVNRPYTLLRIQPVANVKTCAHTSDLSRLLVNVVNLELDVAVRYIEHLVVLLEHFCVPLNTRLKSRQRNGHVVTGGSTAALGVKEQTRAVRRGAEAAAHLEARLDLVATRGSLGDEVLHGEEERDALVVGLDGGGGVVDAVLGKRRKKQRDRRQEISTCVGGSSHLLRTRVPKVFGACETPAGFRALLSGNLRMSSGGFLISSSTSVGVLYGCHSRAFAVLHFWLHVDPTLEVDLGFLPCSYRSGRILPSTSTVACRAFCSHFYLPRTQQTRKQYGCRDVIRFQINVLSTRDNGCKGCRM